MNPSDRSGSEPSSRFSLGTDVLPIAAVLVGLVLLGTTISIHPKLVVDPLEKERERARVQVERRQFDMILNTGGVLLIGLGVGRALWLRRSKGGVS